MESTLRISKWLFHQSSTVTAVMLPLPLELYVRLRKNGEFFHYRFTLRFYLEGEFVIASALSDAKPRGKVFLEGLWQKWDDKVVLNGVIPWSERHRHEYLPVSGELRQALWSMKTGY